MRINIFKRKPPVETPEEKEWKEEREYDEMAVICMRNNRIDIMEQIDKNRAARKARANNE